MANIIKKWIKSARKRILYTKRMEHKMDDVLLKLAAYEGLEHKIHELQAGNDNFATQVMQNQSVVLDKIIETQQIYADFLEKIQNTEHHCAALMQQNHELQRRLDTINQNLIDNQLFNERNQLMLKNLLIKNTANHQQNHKKHVLFMIHNMKTWGALSLIYENMKKRDDVNVFVLAIQNQSQNGLQAAYSSETVRFLNQENISHFSLNENDVERFCALMYAINPDFVIRQSPWDNDVPNLYSALNLSQYKMVYIPYFSLDLVENFQFDGVDMEINQNFHLFCHKIFCVSELSLKYAQQHFLGNVDILRFCGNPKLEYLHQKFVPQRHFDHTGCLNILWSPHHSINNEWLAFGTFEKNCLYMIELLKKWGGKIHIKFRPHPLLATNMQNQFPDLWQQFNDEWQQLSNASVDTHWDYIESFEWSDMLITDGISFVAEYPLTYQPIIFIENEKHIKFNANGDLAYDCCYVAQENHEIEDYIQRFFNHQLPIKEDQLAQYKQNLRINHVAENIVNDILGSLKAIK